MNTFFQNWINPIALQIGPVQIHWYGLMYMITFIFAYFFLKHSKLGKALPLQNNQKENLLISIILGIIIGGRLGYILFYNLQFYLANPPKIFAVWEGGMSFHGGLIGTIIAIWIYLIISKKHAESSLKSDKQTKNLFQNFLQIGDIAVLIAPIGILLGRIGNFINAELYGRISETGKFCLYFPSNPQNCRYPSQLFEAFGEGLLLFTILFILSRNIKTQKTYGKLSALFLIFYGSIRTLIEFTREPDPQIGYLIGNSGFLNGITLGQLLSLFTAFLGIILYSIIIKIAHKTIIQNSRDNQTKQ